MLQQERKRKAGRPSSADAANARATSDLLLDAALAHFATDGFEGASLRRIAADAGVDVGLITYNFGPKLGLWHAAIDRVAATLLDTIAATTVSERGREYDDVLLSHVIGQLVDIVCDTPYLAQFVMREIVRQDERFEYFYDRLIRPIRDMMIPLIADVSRSGGLGGSDPDFFFLAVAGSIVTVVASRPFLGRLSGTAEDEAAFRCELKRAVLAKLAIRFES